MAKSASIIICTHNRSASLIDTLHSVSLLSVPAGVDWEVLVVDNNSSDDTRLRVEAFVKQGQGRVRHLFEPKQGKAHALNLGVAQACGEILAFTDDDALVSRDWLRLILETFDRLDPDCVGGKVVPLWLDKRPDWLTDRLLNVLAMLDLGDQVHALDWQKHEMLYGVNYAFRKEFFQTHGDFNTNLCARGAGNEDQELLQRIRLNNGTAIYDPKICVQHKVFPERMTRAYFRRWHYLVGKDRAQLVTNTKFRVFGIEGYMLRNFVDVLGNYLRSLVFWNREDAFYYKLQNILYLSFFKNRLKMFFMGAM